MPISLFGSTNWQIPVAHHHPIPLALYQYVEKLDEKGHKDANEWIMGPKYHPGEELWRYVGAPAAPPQFYEVGDKEIERHFKSLFLSIRDNSPVPVNLTGWGLHHGHLIKLQGALAILFHAKEYPKEHPPWGKYGDPTEGSTLSIYDKDYHLRNYLWMMNDNKISLLDPKSSSFPRGWIADWASPFYTVDEFAMGDLYLGTVWFLDGSLFWEPKI